MNRGVVLLLVGLVFVTVSCSDLLVENGPSESPVSNFDLLWSEIDRHYSHFIIKDVDWDAVYQAYKPRISPGMSNEEFFHVACDMIEELQDGHVNIFAPYTTCGYDGWYEDYPRNFTFEHVKEGYLHNQFSITSEERIVYGMLDDDIGYIHIASFSGSDWIDDIDLVLSSLGTVQALVVDVRDNGGGSGQSAEDVAGRFADRERLYSYYQYRNGPGHSNFTEPIPMTVEPVGDEQFTGPVAVLTNRACFSACEAFTLAMDVMPNVTVVGDTTGGGLGNPVYRELSNGWSYRFPVWLQTSPDGNTLEGIGFAPDIPVTITNIESWNGIDSILEHAIRILTDA